MPNEALISHFTDASKWIHQSLFDGGRVLVYCWAGVSASPAVIIAYLMNSKALNYEQALLVVRKARPQVYINPGFQK
jgi:dual specificity phosphatase 12